MSLPNTAPEDLLGRIIAGYTLTRILGSGSVGVVMLGEYPAQLLEHVAIKICLPPLHLLAAEREIFQARFVREAEIIQRLQHPHIVPVLQHGVEHGLLYTIFRYMEGGTLAERQLHRTEPMPLAEVRHIITQLADALDAAHAAGVIHRDVKPANILFDQPGRFAQREQLPADDAYLGDFSIVHLQQEASTPLTMTGQSLGTLEYMAPEQASGELSTPAADIYGLGVIAYELITGQPPFVGTTPVQVLWQLLQTAPPSPRRARPDLPEAAEGAVLQALAKAPADRYLSAGAFAVAFARGLDGEWTTPQPIVVADLPPLFPDALIRANSPVADDIRYDNVPKLFGRVLPKHVKRGAAIAVVIILIVLACAQRSTLLAVLAAPRPTTHTVVVPPAIATAIQMTQGVSPTSTMIPAPPTATLDPLMNATYTPQPIPTVTAQPIPTVLPQPIPTVTPQPTPIPPTPLRVNLLINPGFEGNGGWAVSANSFNESGGHNSNTRHTHWNSSSAFSAFTSQTVAHLTSGTYQAAAWIETSCGVAGVTGNVFTIVDSTNNVQIAGYTSPNCQNNWVQIMIQATVSHGTATVKFTSNLGAADWLRMDDFTFMRLS